MTATAIIQSWKNPMARFEEAANPAGDILAELNEQDLAAIAGGCDWWNVSCNLGNQGGFCTLTKECQKNCN
ncbi:plantaricin C family lantibiotic [Metabacillus indicus]|uniref:plantaricin C family lantibiotic n=1 Tax=Metabacillus indicus TaxID=246786 RepID=UPI0024930D56|nr:plantaricin C family lantibiotic [Metabacillus indicus]